MPTSYCCGDAQPSRPCPHWFSFHRTTQTDHSTQAASGGSRGVASLGKNLRAMMANATNVGSAATGANKRGSKAGSAVSGLVPSSVAGVGGKLEKFSSTVKSATTGAVQVWWFSCAGCWGWLPSSFCCRRAASHAGRPALAWRPGDWKTVCRSG